MARLELVYASREAMLADHAASLSKGRAFVPGAHDVAERELCDLAISAGGSGPAHLLPAEVVWIGPNGVGLALLLDGAKKAALVAFVTQAGSVSSADGSTARSTHDERAPSEEERAHQTLHERIRALSTKDREETARRGSLPERVALERAFGGSVWEGLLQNPQLTVAEVARIAKNGTLPKPLVNVIVSNSAWLASADVQRGLLSNPRCTGAHLERVLQAMKRAELLKLAQICPYRPEVRAAVLKAVKR